MVLRLNIFTNNCRGPLGAFIPLVKRRCIFIHKKANWSQSLQFSILIKFGLIWAGRGRRSRPAHFSNKYTFCGGWGEAEPTPTRPCLGLICILTPNYIKLYIVTTPRPSDYHKTTLCHVPTISETNLRHVPRIRIKGVTRLPDDGRGQPSAQLGLFFFFFSTQNDFSLW